MTSLRRSTSTTTTTAATAGVVLTATLLLPSLLLLAVCNRGVDAGSATVGGGGSGKTRGRDDDLIVATESGRVRGRRVLVAAVGKTVDTFLGIPFAKPPVGHLRFRHPLPIEPWSGVLNATTPPNSCMQGRDDEFGDEFYGSNMWNPPTPVSEDCLYLNVYVPRPTAGGSQQQQQQQKTRHRKSAVMVWIYGGGFYSGTTTLSLYDGKILAAENNLIVVSIGYRLGALGFLSLNDASAPGNAGLFDQLLGLEWVQHNIRYFGGDADNVTLFGESAGSVSVSLHLLSPLSRGKFQRAVLQSGTANMPWATLTQEEAKRRSTELAVEYLHCPRTDDAGELAECIRRPQITALNISEVQWVSRGVLQFPFLPVVDGVFLTEPPMVTLRRQTFKKCPILIGSNRNEGSFFVIYELMHLIQLDKKTMTRAQYLDGVERLFLYYPQYPKQLNDRALDAIKQQYTNWLDPEDADKNVHSLDMALADSQFVCPLNHFANSYARAGQEVYMYFFTQRYNSNPWPSWMGVLHGDEIFFVFGEIFKYRHNFTEDERQLSRKMMAYWSNFAKSGYGDTHIIE